MVDTTSPLSIIGFVATALIAQSAAAAVWSIESDCEEGDWSVVVSIAGLAAIDASCVDGGKAKLWVDVGDEGPSAALVEATSISGASCSGFTGEDPRLKLSCGQKVEDVDGFELEEELELEMELEPEELHDEPEDDLEHDRAVEVAS